MKYLVVKKLLPPGKPTNRPLTALNPQGLVIHETATPGATAQDEYDYHARAYRGASAHYFIDPTATLMIIPEDEQSWHAGPSSNKLFLSIEMTRPTSYDPSWFDAVWDRTVDLATDMCIRYGWESTDPIWSHEGVSNRWGETDHTDPHEYLAEYGKTWADLLEAIEERIQEQKRGGKGFMDFILVGRGPDERAAGYLSDYLEAPVAYLDATKQTDIDAAQNVYVVGGNKKPVDRAFLLSGGDRYATCAKVLDFIAKGGK